MLRSEKEQITSNLFENLSKSKIVLGVDYRGLTVKQFSEVRRSLKASGGSAQVVKNTLLKRAFKDAFKNDSEIERGKFENLLNGPTLVVYSTSDPIEPTKILCKFADLLPALTVKGGFFEGEFLSDAKVSELSKMKGREEILGDLLRVILAPATNVVRLLNEPASQVVRVIAAQRDKLN
jgi:large subunit ribosomal protein L10